MENSINLVSFLRSSMTFTFGTGNDSGLASTSFGSRKLGNADVVVFPTLYSYNIQNRASSPQLGTS